MWEECSMFDNNLFTARSTPRARNRLTAGRINQYQILILSHRGECKIYPRHWPDSPRFQSAIGRDAKGATFTPCFLHVLVSQCAPCFRTFCGKSPRVFSTMWGTPFFDEVNFMEVIFLRVHYGFCSRISELSKYPYIRSITK